MTPLGRGPQRPRNDAAVRRARRRARRRSVTREQRRQPSRAHPTRRAVRLHSRSHWPAPTTGPATRAMHSHARAPVPPPRYTPAHAPAVEKKSPHGRASGAGTDNSLEARRPTHKARGWGMIAYEDGETTARSDARSPELRGDNVERRAATGRHPRRHRVVPACANRRPHPEGAAGRGDPLATQSVHRPRAASTRGTGPVYRPRDTAAMPAPGSPRYLQPGYSHAALAWRRTAASIAWGAATLCPLGRDRSHCRQLNQARYLLVPSADRVRAVAS